MNMVGELSPEGWITRCGKWLPCDIEWGHPLVAWLALGGNEADAERRAESLGWVRISDYGDRTCKPLNQAQRNTLWDYCHKFGSDYEQVSAAIDRL